MVINLHEYLTDLAAELTVLLILALLKILRDHFFKIVVLTISVFPVAMIIDQYLSSWIIATGWLLALNLAALAFLVTILPLMVFYLPAKVLVGIWD